jgi:cation transport ATPase
MFKNKLLGQAVLLFSVIALLEVSAEVFYLHWEYWWFDVTLHFFSGWLIGMTFVWFLTFVLKWRTTNKTRLVVSAIVSAFIIGFLWEIFELWANQTTFADGIYYYRDTVSDLILDSCGGLFGALYSFKQISKN